jgi:ABC-type phosphate/phosphonate transport system substrate-binding protein
MRVVATTAPIPADALAAVGATPRELRERFTRTLTGLHDRREGRRAMRRLFGVERFEATRSAAYDAVRHAMSSDAGSRSG